MLILGSSGVTYSDGDRSGSVLGLVEARLRQLRPEAAWECRDGALYLSRSMARRAVAFAETQMPDAVILHIIFGQITAQAVVFKIRRQWPWLYPTALKVAQAWRLLAGGFDASVPGWRRALFTAPRSLLMHTFGAETETRLEDAVAWTCETIDALVQAEASAVICKLPDLLISPGGGDVHARAYIDSFNRQVAAYCKGKRVPAFLRVAPEESAAFAGRTGADVRYASLDLKRAEADRIAGTLIEALEC